MPTREVRFWKLSCIYIHKKWTTALKKKIEKRCKKRETKKVETLYSSPQNFVATWGCGLYHPTFSFMPIYWDCTVSLGILLSLERPVKKWGKAILKAKMAFELWRWQVSFQDSTSLWITKATKVHLYSRECTP